MRPKRGGSNMARIVILDVNPDRQQFYGTALADHIVSFVDRPVEAAYLARAFPQDVVIAEWFDSDGKEVIREIKRLQDFTPPPVILTADLRVPGVTHKATRQALRYGASWFIPLPMARKSFQDEVEAVIRRSGGEPALRMTIVEELPPPTTAHEMVEMLKTIADATPFIGETIGWERLENLLGSVVVSRGVDEAQLLCARIVEWLRDATPSLRAVTYYSRYARLNRTAEEELLFRIANGLLFPES